MSNYTDEAYKRIMDGNAKTGDVCIQHVTDFNNDLPLDQIKRVKYSKNGNARKLGYVYSDKLGDVWFLSKKNAIRFSRI